MARRAGGGRRRQPRRFFSELTDALCDLVRAKVDLDLPGPDGIAPRVHLDEVERQTGRKAYTEPDIPAAAEHIWGWFTDLSDNETLSYAEIAAWHAMTGAAPSAFEVAALRAMFRVRQEAIHARHR